MLGSVIYVEKTIFRCINGISLFTFSWNSHSFILVSHWRLDKTRFHVIGAILFTAQQGALHPTAVVKTRMQVAEGGLAHMSGFAVFRRILRSDGIPGAFRGFGTSAFGALPGRVLALTSLEVSKEMTFKYSERFDMSEASRIAVANGVGGLVSSICSCAYFVPLDVVSIFLVSSIWS